jgi:ketosteroid isomerase-like protein
MSDPKVETIQSIYEAFGRGDIGFILGQLTDDVDWASCPDSDIAPWHGIHRGKAEVPNFFKALGDTLQITEFTPLSFASNETDVMVVTRWSRRGRQGTS